MDRLRYIMDNMIADLEAFPGNVGVSYLVADRMRRFRQELTGSGHLTDRSGFDIIDLRDRPGLNDEP